MLIFEVGLWKHTYPRLPAANVLSIIHFLIVVLVGFEFLKAFGEDPSFLLSLLIKFAFAFSPVLKYIYKHQQSKNYYSRCKDNVLLFYSSILNQKEIAIIFSSCCFRKES